MAAVVRKGEYTAGKREEDVVGWQPEGTGARERVVGRFLLRCGVGAEAGVRRGARASTILLGAVGPKDVLVIIVIVAAVVNAVPSASHDVNGPGPCPLGGAAGVWGSKCGQVRVAWKSTPTVPDRDPKNGTR